MTDPTSEPTDTPTPDPHSDSQANAPRDTSDDKDTPDLPEANLSEAEEPEASKAETQTEVPEENPAGSASAPAPDPNKDASEPEERKISELSEDLKAEFGLDNPHLRCGMVSIVGRANVGKSSLMNRILDEKLSIVSPVAQTTRNCIRGIYTEERGQLVFLDTPGVHKADRTLNQKMNKMARGAAEGVDLVLVMIDPTEPPRLEDDGWFRRVLKRNLPFIIVQNKADLTDEFLPDYIEMYKGIQEELGVETDPELFITSAETGEGVDELIEYAFSQMPLSPLLFPDDMLSDFPRKLAVSDIIREKYFHLLQDELPHAIGVWIQHFDEREDGTIFIKARVYIERASQKGIVIGHKGRLIRTVKRQAIKDLEEIYEKPVDIEIQVRVEKNWQGNYFILKQLGYSN